MSETVSPEVETLLTSEPLPAYFATCHDDRPHVAPLWYLYADGTVEVVTTGRKLANVRENPRVSLAVQKDDGGIPEWTVTLFGTAEVIEERATAREAVRRINEKYGVAPDAWSENTLVRIDVGSATCRTY